MSLRRLLLLFAFCSLHLTAHHVNDLTEVSSQVDSAEDLLITGEASLGAHAIDSPKLSELSPKNGKSKSKLGYLLQSLMKCFVNFPDPQKPPEVGLLKNSRQIHPNSLSPLTRQDLIHLRRSEKNLRISIEHQILDSAYCFGRLVNSRDVSLSQIFRPYQRETQFFKQLKLLELDPNYNTKLLNFVLSKPKQNQHDLNGKPKFDIPDDLMDIILQKTWENLGDPMVEKLKKKMIRNSKNLKTVFKVNRDLEINWWIYMLKSWYFLLKNHFLSLDTIGNFFNDPKMLKLLRSYAQNVFLKEFSHQDMFLIRGSYSLTDHWFWIMSHGALKALSEEAKNSINSDFLLSFRYDSLPSLAGDDRSWRNFEFIINNWQSDYLSLLKDGRREMSARVDKIIRFVASADSETLGQISNDSTGMRHIVVYFCDVLHYIDEKISPGILSQQLENHPDSEKFDNRFKLIRITAQMDSLHLRASQFHEYIKARSPTDWKTSRIYKAVFDHHLNKFMDLFNQYRAETQRLIHQRELIQSALNFFPCTPAAAIHQPVVDYFTSVQTSLEKTSTSFSPSRDSNNVDIAYTQFLSYIP